MDFYKRAVELKDETIKNRRYIHEHAETGLDLPVTKTFVIEKLNRAQRVLIWYYFIFRKMRMKSAFTSCRYGCTSDAGAKW